MEFRNLFLVYAVLTFFIGESVTYQGLQQNQVGQNQVPGMEISNAVRDESKRKFIWNADDPQTFAFLRMCGPYGAFEVQPVSYCSKGIIFKKPFKPHCICPFGVWILKEKLCDNSAYILVGDARRDVCYSVDFKIRSILFLGDPDDVHGSKVYVASLTMSVFHEIPLNGSFTPLLALDHPVVIAIFPIGAVETDEGTCFPLKESNKLKSPVHIWGSDIGPARYRLVKKCSDDFNFGYEDLAGPYNVYIRSNALPATLPRLNCEKGFPEKCFDLPSTTMRPINPIHVSSGITTSPSTTTQKPIQLWLQSMDYGELKEELEKNPVEKVNGDEPVSDSRLYEFLDEEITVDDATRQEYLNPDGTINSENARWVPGRNLTFVELRIEESVKNRPQYKVKKVIKKDSGEDHKSFTTTEFSVVLRENDKISEDTEWEKIKKACNSSSVSQNIPSCRPSKPHKTILYDDEDAVKETFIKLQELALGNSATKDLPYIEYFKNFLHVFVKACPNTIVFSDSLSKILNVFKAIPENQEINYNLISSETHESNLDILEDCLDDTIPFHFRFRRSCPIKVACGKAEVSPDDLEQNFIDVNPLIPKSIAFITALNITIETIWKQFLFVKHHCSKYFVIRDKIDDMTQLFSFLEKIFTEPAVLDKWYRRNSLDSSYLETIFAVENFEDFGYLVDSCVGIGKHFSEMDELYEYIPSYWQKWSERPRKASQNVHSISGASNNQLLNTTSLPKHEKNVKQATPTAAQLKNTNHSTINSKHNTTHKDRVTPQRKHDRVDTNLTKNNKVPTKESKNKNMEIASTKLITTKLPLTSNRPKTELEVASDNFRNDSKSIQQGKPDDVNMENEAKSTIPLNKEAETSEITEQPLQLANNSHQENSDTADNNVAFENPLEKSGDEKEQISSTIDQNLETTLGPNKNDYENPPIEKSEDEKEQTSSTIDQNLETTLGPNENDYENPPLEKSGDENEQISSGIDENLETTLGPNENDSENPPLEKSGDENEQISRGIDQNLETTLGPNENNSENPPLEKLGDEVEDEIASAIGLHIETTAAPNENSSFNSPLEELGDEEEKIWGETDLNIETTRAPIENIYKNPPLKKLGDEDEKVSSKTNPHLHTPAPNQNSSENIAGDSIKDEKLEDTTESANKALDGKEIPSSFTINPYQKSSVKDDNYENVQKIRDQHLETSTIPVEIVLGQQREELSTTESLPVNNTRPGKEIAWNNEIDNSENVPNDTIKNRGSETTTKLRDIVLGNLEREESLTTESSLSPILPLGRVVPATNQADHSEIVPNDKIEDKSSETTTKLMDIILRNLKKEEILTTESSLSTSLPLENIVPIHNKADNSENVPSQKINDDIVEKTRKPKEMALDQEEEEASSTTELTSKIDALTPTDDESRRKSKKKRNSEKAVKELTVMAINSNSMVKVEFPKKEVCNLSKTTSSPPKCDEKKERATLNPEQEKMYSQSAPRNEDESRNDSFAYFYEYMEEATSIFTASCPSKLVSALSILKVLRAFTAFLPENNHEYYAGVTEEAHQLNLEILGDCLTHSQFSLQFHFLKECPVKVSCGSIAGQNKSSYTLDTTIPNSIAFDMASLNFMIETTWKMSLILKYQCGKYFVKHKQVNEMNKLFSFLETIFTMPSLLTKWHQATGMPESVVAELFSIESLQAFVQVIDSCLGAVKDYSRNDEFQPSILQEWIHRPAKSKRRKRRDAWPSPVTVWQGNAYCIESYLAPLDLLEMTTTETCCKTI